MDSSDKNKQTTVQRLSIQTNNRQDSYMQSVPEWDTASNKAKRDRSFQRTLPGRSRNTGQEKIIETTEERRNKT